VVLAPPDGWQMVLAALLVPMAVGSYSTYTSPLGRNAPPVSTPDRLVADMPCIERRDLLAPFQPAGIRGPARIEHLLSCAPSPAVVRWAEAHIPVSAVVAMNKWNEYAPSWFLPQQFVTWASPTPVLLHEEDVFASYFRYYHRSLANYGQQPFFNDRESRDERVGFVRDLAVTHILVDPQTHDLMTRVLTGYADLFVRRYDDGRWAVWEVLHK